MTTAGELLACRVNPGESIKPWLILGPFYRDFSDRVEGLTLFEKKGARTGRELMSEVVGAADRILSSSPREGQEESFLGECGHWMLVRRPEPYLSWGRYNISNHLGAAFVATIVTPERPGQTTFELVTGLSSRILVAVNGTTVFDSGAHPVDPVGRLYRYSFTADLKPGDNTITLALFRLARMTQVGFRLQVPDSALQARVPLAEGMSRKQREEVEKQVLGLRLERDVFYPDHDIAVHLNQPPSSEAALRLRLVSEDGTTAAECEPREGGRVNLCRAGDLADGSYRLECSWIAGGQPVTGTVFDVTKVTPTPALIGPKRYEERRRTVLEHFSRHSEPNHHGIWGQVARYGLGRYDEVDESVIADTCRFVAARKDCADFVIQAILRLLYWERENPRLSPGIRALMKDTVLGFKYWVDEPGDTVMYMGSENHRLLFHVAEWLAGQLFPTEEFTNSRQRGLYHATKGRMYITEWLRQRGRFGFDEWHSNSYFPVNIAPLLNVYDFAIYEDAKLKQMAKAVLDYMFYILAADTFHGVFGTTHGRSYAINLKHPAFEGTASICWLLYGEGSLWGGHGMDSVSLATSAYRVPEIFTRIAADRTAVVEAKERHGLLEGKEQSANFIVYRTPDYMLSGLQDHDPGAFSPQIHPAQVTLENGAVIFWSCPHTSGEGSGLRPDYWSGNTTLPRVVQYRNVLALVWRQNEVSWMTHCFFDRSRFDEVRISSSWAFARVNRGYVGIYSQHGMQLGELGQYAGRELICTGPENTWIVECGREADWGSFDRFVQALQAAEIKVEEGRLVYTSPSIGEFAVGWEGQPTVNGRPVELRDYPLVDSVWAKSKFGSGYLKIQYEGEEMEIWFNQ